MVHMPIDSNIYSGIKMAQIDTPENALAKLLQVQGAQQEQRIGQMKMDEYQRGVADETQMRDLTKQSGGDMNKLRELMYGAGNYKQGSAIDSSIAKQKKESADGVKAQYETEFKKIELAGQIMNGVVDQASYTRARQQTAQVFGPEAATKMPEQYDPALIAENQAKSLSIKDRLDQQYKMLTLQETKDNNLRGDTRARDAQGIAIRGQNITQQGQQLADSRARDFNATKVEENNIKRAEGKPLNESQSKALLFGSRMRDADKVLRLLAEEGTNSSVPGQNMPLIGGMVTAASSANQQSLKQVKLDFTSAVLRRESGAAILTSEYDNADKQYFPQVGDSEQVIEQKARNRQLAIQGVLAEVPEKNRDSLQTSSKNTTSNALPTVGMVSKGHRFKGGDPSQQSSWEKVQ